YRVHGPYEPEAGHRFNPNNLLIDPYAKSSAVTIQWSDARFGYTVVDPHAGNIPKCVVLDQAFSWGGDHLLKTAWDKTIIYEVNVKGFTARHPDVPEP